jgi:hypothetical protein
MTNKKRSMADDIIGAIREGTKKWTKTIKSEERAPSTRSYRRVRMTAERGTSFKEAAEEIMRSAYNQASGNGIYPANARQIMYAARPFIQKATGKPLKSEYFTQVLLPNYLGEHSYITDNWNVVYDARGHFSEPHTDKVFGVGTLAVRNYLDSLRE